MTFTPRTLADILKDSIAHVEQNSEITDAEVGSIVRTLLEAAAIEDYEQYYQMTQVLSMFSIYKATGEGLRLRLADYNSSILGATPAVTKVRFMNGSLVRDNIALDAVAGSTLIKVFDTIDFPSSGFPYTIRLAEGTARVHDVTVTAVNSLANTFTLSTPLSYSLEVGDLVSLVSGASSVVNKGTNLRTVATATNGSRAFRTDETAYIAPGNYWSNTVNATATVPGSQSRIAAGKLTQFVSAPPFSGCLVTNITKASGGLDAETEAAAIRRVLNAVQALGKGTPLALTSSSVGVTDLVTNLRVSSASIVENFPEKEVTVYIDSASSDDADTVKMPSSSVDVAASIGAASLSLADTSAWPSSGNLLIGVLGVVQYNAKSATGDLVLDSALTFAVPSGTVARYVERNPSSAESGQRRFRTQQVPIVRNSDLIYTKEAAASTWSLLPRSAYSLNRGTGELFILDDAGLPAGTEVVYSYTTYINMVATVHRVLEGDPNDYTTTPGVKAAGIHLTVEPPVSKRVPVSLSIVAEEGYSELDLAPQVVAAIENYFASLTIGEDVVYSKLIDLAYITGVYDVYVKTPKSNVTVLEYEKATCFSTTGESLVTVV